MNLLFKHTSKKITTTIIILTFLFTTSLSFLVSVQPAYAFPWGGQFQQVIPCFNDVIWVLVGPPLGGRYIWVPGTTRTYDYGPPKHAGQWGLGLASPPYFCIVYPPPPLIIFPGIIMTMLGTSK